MSDPRIPSGDETTELRTVPPTSSDATTVLGAVPADQHDTTALQRPAAPASGTGAPGHGWSPVPPAHGGYQPAEPYAAATYPPGDPYAASGTYLPGDPYAAAGTYPPGDPYQPYQPGADASHWYGQYRRQRRRTRILGVLVIVLSFVVVGLAGLSWTLAQSNPLTSAISQITGEDALPEAAPEPLAPEAPPMEQPAIPLPEPLRDLGARLGITDVGQLLDIAVANGLMSEQDADALRQLLAPEPPTQ